MTNDPTMQAAYEHALRVALADPQLDVRQVGQLQRAFAVALNVTPGYCDISRDRSSGIWQLRGVIWDAPTPV